MYIKDSDFPPQAISTNDTTDTLPSASTDTSIVTPEPSGWRSRLPVHPAADLIPVMTEAELRDLTDDIKANGLRVPVDVQPDEATGKLMLLDGRHRLDALERLDELDGFLADLTLGNTQVIDRIRPDVDAYAFVISKNLKRRHLSPEQKREVIAGVLKARPEKSDRQIAKETDSNRTTVGQIRKKLETAGDVSVDTRIDSTGREQPAHKPSRRIEATHPAESSQRGNGVDPEESADLRRAAAADEEAAADAESEEEPAEPQQRKAEAAATDDIIETDDEAEDAEPTRPKKAKRQSRVAEWADAASRAVQALEELHGLQSDYESWRENLPENFQGSALAEKLDAVCDLDLASALEIAQEAEGADLPMGFGRD